MAKSIYTEMDAVLRPPMEQAQVKPEDVAKAQAAWRKLSYAVAAGVIGHLKRDPPGDPEFARVVCKSAGDGEYWSWLTGFVQVFQTWAPVSADAITLQTALTTYLGPHPVPTQLTGSLE